MPEQTEQLSVPAALLAHAFIRRDHHHRRIGAGRPGDHVLQEFLMTRRVDDDVVTPGAPKLNLRRIDRDVLLLLLRERIEHKGVFERLALRRARLAEALSILPSGSESVSSQNPADQRRLAVIDMTDENDLQTWNAETGDRKPETGNLVSRSRIPFPVSHESSRSQLLHGVRLVMILGAAGALARARGFELGDDFFDGRGVARDRVRDRVAA